jgi:hypothetical protein
VERIFSTVATILIDRCDDFVRPSQRFCPTVATILFVATKKNSLTRGERRKQLKEKQAPRPLVENHVADGHLVDQDGRLVRGSPNYAVVAVSARCLLAKCKSVKYQLT